MGVHVKNIIHVDVYWKKTLSFGYESVKYTSMDVNKGGWSVLGVRWRGSMPCRVSPPPPSETSQQTGRCSLSSYRGVLRQLRQPYEAAQAQEELWLCNCGYCIKQQTQDRWERKERITKSYHNSYKC